LEHEERHKRYEIFHKNTDQDEGWNAEHGCEREGELFFFLHFCLGLAEDDVDGRLQHNVQEHFINKYVIAKDHI
jgi:hypothetical protein